MVPLIAAEAIGVGVAVGLRQTCRAGGGAPRRGRCSPSTFGRWIRPHRWSSKRNGTCRTCARGNRSPTACVRSTTATRSWRAWDRSAITCRKPRAAASRVRDFLHEGNGDIWLAALDGPRPYAGWVLIEEKAEGGDMLAAIARERPAFLDGYERVCSGAGLALYRRTARTVRNQESGTRNYGMLGMRAANSLNPESSIPNCRSESDVDREEIVEPAEIDLRSGEIQRRRQIAFPALLPDLAAET